jgi:hypothetical protein
MSDQEVQVLQGIGSIADGTWIEFEDFLLKVVIYLLHISPGLNCLSEAFCPDLEVLEHHHLSVSVVIDGELVKQ